MTKAILASCKPAPAKPNGPSPKATATAAGGLFSPQSKSLGLDLTDTAPTLQRKITYAGTAARSFAEAHALLHELADLTIDTKQVERLTERIGHERVAQRDAEVAAFRALTAPQKVSVPPGAKAPELAVVRVDGGRLQILDRKAAAAAATAPATAEAATPVSEPVAAGGTEAVAAAEADASAAAGAEAATLPAPPEAADVTAASAWDEEEETSDHWREDKMALLLTMKSEVSVTDPCPEIPATFLDVVRIPELARELKKGAAARGDGVAEAGDPDAAAAALQEETYQPPEVLSRRVVASRQRWPAFAPVVAAVGWGLALQGAARKAFVADGSSNNWRLQRRFFATFVPILDFIHALSYVFAAAMAGRGFAVGWACYQQWIRWVWQGQVVAVIVALRERQAELGLPEKEESETSPRQVVAKTLRYLENHQDKMKYAEYRQGGLPITSSLMESTVKQINQRVKGTEKFWSEPGSEAVLQMRADQLSDGGLLDEFWGRRQEEATGQRPYRRAG